ncbi:hypothetical protein DPMN_186186 [Dreissena polymorpha]|uniref:Uncharacterized protein n=1 Tax=Dreissena polymorpha TaxID=45954 RepID=A0A9D4DM89_DREPO|nr:hypothetical protein DPMN_186186 [Dreissena polymorpha]
MCGNRSYAGCEQSAQEISGLLYIAMICSLFSGQCSSLPDFATVQADLDLS